MIIQVIKIHPDVDETYKKLGEELVPKVLRLRYWGLISATFADTYSADIKAMYTAVGLPEKSFSGMSRPELIAEVASIQDAFDDTTPKAIKSFVHNVLKAGLVDLDEAVIPNTWI